jgi:hypothetical protein
MNSKSQKGDVVQSTVRGAGEAMAKHEKPLPGDLEAAWAEWSRNLPGVDARGLVLLRAAFEAGWAAGVRSKNNIG